MSGNKICCDNCGKFIIMDDDGCDPVAEDAIGAVEVFKTIDYCHTETINIYCSEKCYREKRI